MPALICQTVCSWAPRDSVWSPSHAGSLPFGARFFSDGNLEGGFRKVYHSVVGLRPHLFMPELLLQLLNTGAKNVNIIRRTALALLESALWLAFCCVLAHVSRFFQSVCFCKFSNPSVKHRSRDGNLSDNLRCSYSLVEVKIHGNIAKYCSALLVLQKYITVVFNSQLFWFFRNLVEA